MSDETAQLRQRVSQLESDIRVLRAALAFEQANRPAAGDLTEELTQLIMTANSASGPLDGVKASIKKRGRPAKAKE